MNAKPNILVVESVGNLLVFLKNILSQKFNVISAMKFSKVKPFLENVTVILSDYHNCDSESWPHIQQIHKDRPEIAIVLMVTDKEFQQCSESSGQIPLVFVKKPLDKNNLLAACVDALDKKQKKADSGLLQAYPLDCDLSSLLLRSFNRKQVACRGKKVSKSRLEITADEEHRVGTEMLFIFKQKGHSLKVEFCNVAVVGSGFHIGLKVLDDQLDLIQVFRSLNLIVSAPKVAMPTAAAAAAAPAAAAAAVPIIGSDVAKPDLPTPSDAKEGYTGPKILDGFIQRGSLPAWTLVIDDDEFIRMSLEKGLKEGGIANLVSSEDGQHAWQEAMRKKFNLIVLDWVLPKIDGKALLNRFRGHFYYKDIPILVISGFSQKQNFGLLKDFPLVTLMEKPFQTPELLKQVKQLMLKWEQWQICQKNTQNWLSSFKDVDPAEIAKNLGNFISGPDSPYLAYVASWVFIEKGLYTPALSLLKLARQSKELVEKVDVALVELEMKRQNFANAKSILINICKTSPNNTNSLNYLGRVCLEEQDFETARKYFGETIRIDPQSVKATSGISLVNSLSAWVSTQKAGEVPQQFGALLNTVGVDFVKRDKIKEGIDHYQAALHHVFDNSAKAKLAYNLGLAYKKSQDLAQALTWFEKSFVFDPSLESAKRQIDTLRKEVAGALGLSKEKPTTPVATTAAPGATPAAPAGTAASNRRAKQREISKLGMQRMGDTEPEKDPEYILRRACPIYPEFAKYLGKNRINVIEFAPKLVTLITKFGATALNASMRKVISDNIPGVDYLMDVLRHKKYEPILPEDSRPSSFTILLIDDDDTFKSSLVQKLTDLSIEALQCKSAKDAIPLLNEKKDISLLLVASELPDMDGLKAIYEIKAMPGFADLPTIMLTPKFDQRKMTQAVSIGCEDTHVKTQDISQLVGKIQAILN